MAPAPPNCNKKDEAREVCALPNPESFSTHLGPSFLVFNPTRISVFLPISLQNHHFGTTPKKKTPPPPPPLLLCHFSWRFPGRPSRFSDFTWFSGEVSDFKPLKVLFRFILLGFPTSHLKESRLLSWWGAENSRPLAPSPRPKSARRGAQARHRAPGAPAPRARALAPGRRAHAARSEASKRRAEGRGGFGRSRPLQLGLARWC